MVFLFCSRYSFHLANIIGVDIDWEYPGAADRGGKNDDGINFTAFLKELRDAIGRESTNYIVSFTAPSSYWYLRHFDIKAMMEYVDWTNLMTYDLHGTWDSTNPIGSHVLAHTNLTEIKQALDLFWRNDVPAEKVSLGLGFYRRSFQLADPSCSKPGCLFKGGAAPGPVRFGLFLLPFADIDPSAARIQADISCSAPKIREHFRTKKSLKSLIRRTLSLSTRRKTA